MHRPVALALTAGAVLWTAVLIGAPLVLAHGPAPLVPAAALVYASAGFICHQRPERSFHLAGIQLPVCARCFGIYASAMAGAVAAVVAARAVPRSTTRRVVLGLAAVPTAVTVALEVLGAAHPSNLARAIAAIPLGAAAAWIVVAMLSRDVRPA